MFLRCLFTLLLCEVVLCQNDLELDALIESIFGQDDRIPSEESSKCESIEGVLSGGCFECYSCDHVAVVGRDAEQIKYVTLNDGACNASVRLCCVLQSVLLSNKFGDICGVSNPDGVGPRQLRPTPTTVLPGEYPWIAAIYKKQKAKSKFMCAATMVGERAFLTSASCVKGTPSDQLAVAFDEEKGATSSVTVAKIILHENYDRSTGLNDLAIAIVPKGAGLPVWVRPACLPERRPLPAMSCFYVSADKTALPAVQLRRASCERDGAPLPASLLCAAAAATALTPPPAAALLCATEEGLVPEYTQYGVACGNPPNDGLSLYTNVAHYKDWIEQNILENQ